MSADIGYTLDRDELLAAAGVFRACMVFRVERGGSHHVCENCGERHTAHVIVALRQTCVTCAHGDTDAARPGGIYCTRAGSEWNGKRLPLLARCDQWEAGS